MCVCACVRACVRVCARIVVGECVGVVCARVRVCVHACIKVFYETCIQKYLPYFAIVPRYFYRINSEIACTYCSSHDIIYTLQLIYYVIPATFDVHVFFTFCLIVAHVIPAIFHVLTTREITLSVVLQNLSFSDLLSGKQGRTHMHIPVSLLR